MNSDPPPASAPSWRKPVGMLLIVAIIIGWAVIVASVADMISSLPRLVQALIYIIAGLIWILPLKPLLAWMETGRFRRF
jgi:predicted membrane channel-forming protein YqfA (hemolysin III family)